MIPNMEAYAAYKKFNSIDNGWRIEETGARRSNQVLLRSESIRKHLKKNPEEASDFIEFLPIGYFQLFYCKSNIRYPTFWGDAQGDAEFAFQFEKHEQLSYSCLHLPVVGGADSIANWKGRTTPQFSIKENPEQA
jgi:hypothetical protein